MNLFLIIKSEKYDRLINIYYLNNKLFFLSNYFYFQCKLILNAHAKKNYSKTSVNSLDKKLRLLLMKKDVTLLLLMEQLKLKQFQLFSFILLN